MPDTLQACETSCHQHTCCCVASRYSALCSSSSNSASDSIRGASVVPSPLHSTPQHSMKQHNMPHVSTEQHDSAAGCGTAQHGMAHFSSAQGIPAYHAHEEPTKQQNRIMSQPDTTALHGQQQCTLPIVLKPVAARPSRVATYSCTAPDSYTHCGGLTAAPAAGDAPAVASAAVTAAAAGKSVPSAPAAAFTGVPRQPPCCTHRPTMCWKVAKRALRRSVGLMKIAG